VLTSIRLLLRATTLYPLHCTRGASVFRHLCLIRFTRSWFARIRRRVEEDLRNTRDELESLNHELAKRSAALEASNKELEAFAYSISHDLRAPLRHVAGFAELLRNSAAQFLNEKSTRYLTVVLEEANRMGSLIDDLLAFSRIGRAEAHYSTISLQQIVQEAVAEARQDANGRNIVWRVEASPEWYGDRSTLRLVVINLISNAVKFTRTRSEPEIEIGCSERKNDHVGDIEEHYAAIYPELPSGPRELLKQYIKEGRLGLKTGKEFYTDYGQKAPAVARELR
jgi:light-regulated signal transduction histidine kinase (bacteriophytochrome)